METAPTPLPPGAPAPPAGVHLLRRLAVGGTAELFLAEQTVEGGGVRPVVLKRALDPADPVAEALLAREGRVLACIDSPHVVRYLGHGPGYVLLDRVEGSDLGALLQHLARRGRPLPLPAALAVLDGLLQGLEALHRATDPAGRPLGAVHRDVGPANVLLGRDGAVRLADLGVVRADLPDLPTQAGFKGTLAYMAPEQLLGQPVGPATDVYAAGLVAYEALTGVPARPPGMTGLAELIQARSGLPAAPDVVRPELPAALSAAVLEALAPDPAARPASAEAFRRALLQAAGATPAPDALATLVRAVSESVVPASRTVGPTLAPAPPVAPPRRPVGWWLGALVVLAVAGWLWLTPSPPAERLVADEPDADRSAEDLRPSRGAHRRTSAAGAPRARRAPASTPVHRRAVAAAARQASRPPAALPPRGVAQRPIAPVAPHVRVLSHDGPLHVRGGGASGLAPQHTQPLEQAQVLRLVGRGGARATVRVSADGDRVTAAIGAPPGRFYAVRCGGRDLGTTPVTAVRVQRTTRCDLSGDAGSLAFTLEVP